MPNIPMPAQVKKPAAAASTSKVAAELPANFSKDQAKKAVKALLAHHAKDKEHVWLVINTRRMPTKKSLKPSRMLVSSLSFHAIVLGLTRLFFLAQQSPSSPTSSSTSNLSVPLFEKPSARIQGSLA
jgi:hypothetical protein